MTIGLPLAPQHRVYAGFAIYSFAMGNIFPRLPDIKQAMGIDESALGLGLIGTPVGTLAALTCATPLLERIGYRRALLPLIPLITTAYVRRGLCPRPARVLPAAHPGRPDDRLHRDRPRTSRRTGPRR